ncbi:hypothetical protein EXN65_16390 [Clostridium botulinum]|uniref:Uncharacterized protein n=2 Tax=Clostridium botulinum TaxID=1491 RepID=A0A846I385_CLOBO|nr:hypothetical protein CLJ_B2112 [Clostridium botulinum Ba4 str. 657]AUN03441.1 hypothetical protein RSJ19_11130 [Clostridium botulinum]EDT83976.1 hypothetical protein CBB_2179 [Clostridium botulinum Bf]EPS50062.1 hypothetical protein CFSAN002368_15605 [Clostridium botulinum A1 str. CFSAN002368]AXG90904.1 hypothetical protein AGE29_03630 [Clostridium botulinum]
MVRRKRTFNEISHLVKNDNTENIVGILGVISDLYLYFLVKRL